MLEEESDRERSAKAPERAFEWVAQELQFPSPTARNELKAVFLTVVNLGHSAAVRALGKVWDNGTCWASGEDYLRSLGWKSPGELELLHQDALEEYLDTYDGPDLLDVLHGRLVHVSHRMYRDHQVKSMLSWTSNYFDCATLNRFHQKDEDICGIGVDRRVSVEEALKHMENPVHSHPACQCTIDPERSKRRT